MVSLTKKLTITFPLYGQHEMVKRAFTALSHQTNQDFKIVCLDDKSPKPFDELVDEFKNSLDITIKYNDRNLGAMQNIWQSIQLPVDTPYIMSHHADDYLKADYLEKVIAILDNNPDISFVVTGPVWVPSDEPFIKKMLGDSKIDFFDAADFAFTILKFVPYIFGSVVYRQSHLVSDWKYEQMDTFCDRYFMGEILRQHNSRGAYINGLGIIEHDHSKDSSDNRSPKLNEDHAIHLLSFYKELIREKYSLAKTETIITNALLYYYGHFNNRSSIRNFYRKSHRANLLQLRRLRGLGLYALIVLPLNEQRKRSIIQTVKKIIAPLSRKT